jgi:hypothetical protein
MFTGDTDKELILRLKQSNNLIEDGPKPIENPNPPDIERRLKTCKCHTYKPNLKHMYSQDTVYRCIISSKKA